MSLTSQQSSLATAKKQHIISSSTAGSGKTHTLVHAISDKIKHKEATPNEIIQFSFTRKAAGELKERVSAHFKGRLEFKYISTIHSFCWELIQNNYKLLGFTEKPAILVEIPDEFINKSYGVEKLKDKNLEKKVYNDRLRRNINQDISAGEYNFDETALLAEFLVKNNLMLMDYMLVFANSLLEAEPDHFAKAIGVIKYLIVDEAQDLNNAQYMFIGGMQKLFQKVNGECWLIFVGDGKQGIYSFRGSDPKILNDFIDEYAPTSFPLTINWRSAPEIVEFTNSIAMTIDLGDPILNAERTAEAGRTELAGDVASIYDFEDFLEELKVLEKPLHHNCILMRTNHQLRAMSKLLETLKIPYYVHTEFDILRRKEVKVLMNLLALATQSFNAAMLQEVVTTVKGSLPIKVRNLIHVMTSMHDLKSAFDVTGIKPIYDIYMKLHSGDYAKAFDILSVLVSEKDKPKEAILDKLNKFWAQLIEVKKDSGCATWMEALDIFLFEASFLNQKTENKVQLMTTHKSKGLQWNNVIFIYDMQILEREEDSFYNTEEEKRVVYVACSRPIYNLAVWDIRKEDLTQLFGGEGASKVAANALKKGVISYEDFYLGRWDRPID